MVVTVLNVGGLDLVSHPLSFIANVHSILATGVRWKRRGTFDTAAATVSSQGWREFEVDHESRPDVSL